MFGGKVVHGDGLGKQYGYPTANLENAKSKLKLKQGVYATYAQLEKQQYEAALSVKENPLKIEIYLFNYQGVDFYDKYLEVDPLQKVSEIERYDNEDELKEKIRNDIGKVKEYFEEIN